LNGRKSLRSSSRTSNPRRWARTRQLAIIWPAGGLVRGPDSDPAFPLPPRPLLTTGESRRRERAGRIKNRGP
jgi:hypothetical protein